MKNLTFGKKRRRRIHFETLEPVIAWVIQIAIVCVAAFVLVWYFGHRVQMSGTSMAPQINNGDVVLVNRLAYNVSRPKRGDVIAFQPNGAGRIIGLPGESVEVENPTGSIQLSDDEYLVSGDNNKNADVRCIKRSEIEGKVWFLVTLGKNFGLVK